MNLFLSLRHFNQIRGKRIGIEDLAFVKDALHRWQGRAHEEINFIFEIMNPFRMFLQLTIDVLFRELDALINGISSQ